MSLNLKQSTEEIEQIPEISCLDFGKPAGVLGRFLNYSRYKVFGINENGKRSFKLCTGRSPEDAIRKTAEAGLAAPYETVEIDPEPATERQLALLDRHGTAYPAELTKDDASAMIYRICDEFRRDCPEPWLTELADNIGTEFSAYIGGDQLFDFMIWQASVCDRAALYSYAVHQSMNGQPFGNMLTDPDCDRFYDFAEIVTADASLVKSLECREPADYLNPQRSTKIYKAAAAFLEGGAQ